MCNIGLVTVVDDVHHSDAAVAIVKAKVQHPMVG